MGTTKVKWLHAGERWSQDDDNPTLQKIAEYRTLIRESGMTERQIHFAALKTLVTAAKPQTIAKFMSETKRPQENTFATIRHALGLREGLFKADAPAAEGELRPEPTWVGLKRKREERRARMRRHKKKPVSASTK